MVGHDHPLVQGHALGALALQRGSHALPERGERHAPLHDAAEEPPPRLGHHGGEDHRPAVVIVAAVAPVVGAGVGGLHLLAEAHATGGVRPGLREGVAGGATGGVRPGLRPDTAESPGRAPPVVRASSFPVARTARVGVAM